MLKVNQAGGKQSREIRQWRRVFSSLLWHAHLFVKIDLAFALSNKPGGSIYTNKWVCPALFGLALSTLILTLGEVSGEGTPVRVSSDEKPTASPNLVHNILIDGQKSQINAAFYFMLKLNGGLYRYTRQLTTG